MILPMVMLLAQTMSSGPSPSINWATVQATTPATPECEKYQHLVPEHNESCSRPGDASFCEMLIPASCAADMHEITEQEWVELVMRLKALEKRIAKEEQR